jgi:hypothetical protein
MRVDAVNGPWDPDVSVPSIEEEQPMSALSHIDASLELSSACAADGAGKIVHGLRRISPCVGLSPGKARSG